MSMTDTGTITLPPVEGTPPAATTPPAPPAQPAHSSRVFTQEEIEEARRQEKEKLYPRIDKLQQQIDLFNQEREAALALAAEQQAAADAERKRREDDELGLKDLVIKKEDEWKASFNTAQAEWEEKFNRLQAESEARQELLLKERAFQELQSYANRRLAEEQENIMPELMDMVGGNTEEEIESSISAAAAKTAAIVASIQQNLPQQRQPLRGISPVGGTPSGPLENITEQQTLTAEMISAMSMEQWALIRDRVLPATSPRNRSR